MSRADLLVLLAVEDVYGHEVTLGTAVFSRFRGRDVIDFAGPALDDDVRALLTRTSLDRGVVGGARVCGFNFEFVRHCGLVLGE